MRYLRLFILWLFIAQLGQAQPWDWHHTPEANGVPFSDDDFSSDNVHDAIVEAKQNAEGFPRAGIVLVHNGTIGNNDWLTYSSLTPDAKIVFPVKTKLNELTWANSKSSLDSDFEFYKNGTAAGDLIWTYQLRNTSDDFGYQLSVDLFFEAGDWIRILHKDFGTNPSDFVMTLWISRIQE